MAGPKRPQDKVVLTQVDDVFNKDLAEVYKHDGAKRVPVEGKDHDIGDGDVVIAAITSCTNTSNPGVMVAAGLVARKANERGLKPKPWVKTSLAPGSQVVTDYLVKAGLQEHLDAVGFNLVGYGCTTCIGNSGPLAEPISKAINGNDIVAASVISGNRNFEGRVSPDVRANFLASPPLVVAYALKGTVTEDFTTTPIGKGSDGADVYLKDIWPTNQEISDLMTANVSRDMFLSRYATVYQGDAHWQAIQVEGQRNLSVARGQHLCRQPALFRRAEHDSAADFGHHRRQAARDPRRSASPPTTSAPPAASRQTAPPENGLWNIRLAKPTSTATAPAAATMK